MKVKSIKIQNYKSFGEANNILQLDNLNTIIGKNESGKSNLIDCLSKLDFTGHMDSFYFKNFNKNTGNYPIISVVLTPYKSEKTIYKSNDDTVLTINDRFDINIEGGISEIINKNKDFQKNRERMNELNNNVAYNNFNDENTRKNYNQLINMINNAEKSVFIDYTYIKSITEKIYNNDNYEEFSEYLKKCLEYLRKINKLFPSFIELEDISLKSKYTKSYLDDNSKNKTMLKHLLNCINMDLDDVMDYWNLSSEADKTNFNEDINEKLTLVIDEFNKFYKQEIVQMKITFENDSLNFVVRTTKKYIDFEERSNGLKWYLNMYLQLLSKTKKYDIENYIILLDEPGVYLHINAQKEVLKLFENFVKNDNQIIYTTQLPSMIYQDKLYRTRLIIKDSIGNSNIGNKYYSLPHKMGSKLETITPLLLAIGMNMGYNFSSLSTNSINIITEGISDYHYLKGYFIQKGINDINIIPSSSVDNIHNIASILIGWGYKFKIILDQDNAGRGQQKVLINKLLISQDDICFINGTNLPEKNSTITIENIFSTDDKSHIGINNEDYSKEKAYYSLETLKKIENNEFQYDANTIRNFEKIIKLLIK